MINYNYIFSVTKVTLFDALSNQYTYNLWHNAAGQVIEVSDGADKKIVKYDKFGRNNGYAEINTSTELSQEQVHRT